MRYHFSYGQSRNKMDSTKIDLLNEYSTWLKLNEWKENLYIDLPCQVGYMWFYHTSWDSLPLGSTVVPGIIISIRCRSLPDANGAHTLYVYSILAPARAGIQDFTNFSYLPWYTVDDDHHTLKSTTCKWSISWIFDLLITLTRSVHNTTCDGTAFSFYFGTEAA